MSDLLVVVASPDAARALPPLAAALGRAGAHWTCFLTGRGTQALALPAVAAALAGAGQAVACEHSWRLTMGDAPCSVEAGSQFHLSLMLGDARRTLTL